MKKENLMHSSNKIRRRKENKVHQEILHLKIKKEGMI